jgi:hypothetical protein
MVTAGVTRNAKALGIAARIFVIGAVTSRKLQPLRGLSLQQEAIIEAAAFRMADNAAVVVEAKLL